MVPTLKIGASSLKAKSDPLISRQLGLLVVQDNRTSFDKIYAKGTTSIIPLYFFFEIDGKNAYIIPNVLIFR